MRALLEVPRKKLSEATGANTTWRIRLLDKTLRNRQRHFTATVTLAASGATGQEAMQALAKEAQAIAIACADWQEP